MSTITEKNFVLKNGRKLILRTAMVKDAGQIVQLMRDVIKEGPFTLQEHDEYKATAKSEAAKIRRCMEAPGKIYLAAEIRKEIAGYISFDNWDTRRTSHTGLFSVFIRKKFRGMGIGRILVQGMLDWAKESPVNKKISLYVFSTNKGAIALYKKLGFKVEGLFKRDMIIDGKYVDSVAMYKYTK